MEWSNVEEVNLIALRGQPAGMAARPAADVEDRGRRRRQEASHQLAGAFAIQLTGARKQPADRVAGGVVGGDGFGRWGVYRFTTGHALLSRKAVFRGECLAHREGPITRHFLQGYQHAGEGSPLSA